MTTPLTNAESAFRALCRLPHPVWLDSALVQPVQGQRSIVTAAPTMRLTVGLDGRSRVVDAHDEVLIESAADPFALLGDLAVCTGSDPTDTTGGDIGGIWVGYLGYDLKNGIEKLPAARPDGCGLPTAWFGYYPTWLEFDHESGEAKTITRQPVATPLPSISDGHLPSDVVDNVGHEPALRAAQSMGPLALPAVTLDLPEAAVLAASDFATRADYEAAVARAIEYVHAGDIFQANISQRFCLPFDGSPVALYLALRRANPAPFAAFIGVEPTRAVLSSSPERFLELAGHRLQSRPIKGTRERRPNDDAGNERRRAELLASEKDRAELAMIVDLVRNDLGKVSEPGSVRVVADAEPETYETVFHLTATIESRLRDGYTAVGALRAAFPGGSITGAPKIRAMEVIDELEPAARGVYTGSIGYLQAGRMDFNIAIRTMSVGNGALSFHAGGGIVADSDPADEYDETLAKARGLIRALSS